ncbi:YheC/YheD family protein [Bacillus suaedaesalsae]|uniref:YheC/YheD family protein n=1 Tax=Bacillus suaedaesalsae TaxID=2810349 RepID=A0ABS2DL13_9BACI|nr:YheC/YheD family protein [Bacillus suaedaesalsae]MBM6618221.1 YheC/YheD family protein [Bacillus suaedaesalsae]
MNVQWENEQEKDTIILPSTLNNNLVNNVINVQLGSCHKNMKVQFSNEESNESIQLPNHFTDQITLPINLPFDSKLENNILNIGPVIGFLLCNKKEDLEPLLADDFDDYVHNYEEVRGLIYAFSSEGIDLKTKTIEGYYLDPTDPMNCWKEGVFPYPSALYRRTLIPSKILSELETVIGMDRIFNTRYYHKWDLYKLLNKHSNILKYFPETKQFNNEQVLAYMLNKYSSVYFKPINGTYGHGICKIERVSKGYQLIKRSSEIEEIQTFKELFNYLESKVKKGSYIIQQDVAFQKQGKNIDFRMMVQKNQKRKWNCNAFIARFGEKKKIYTNDPSDVQDGYMALQSMFQLTDEELRWKEQEICSICKDIGKTFDQYGHYADLGIDLTVDKNMNVWILEINHLFQDHDMAAYLNDEYKTYEKVLSTLLDYLKTLAGF